MVGVTLDISLYFHDYDLDTVFSFLYQGMGPKP